MLNILENKKPANHAAKKPHFVSASCRAQHPGKQEASKQCRKKAILLALVVVLNILENKKPANHAEKTHFVSASCRAQHPRDPPPGFTLFALFNSGRELNNLNNFKSWGGVRGGVRGPGIKYFKSYKILEAPKYLYYLIPGALDPSPGHLNSGEGSGGDSGGREFNNLNIGGPQMFKLFDSRGPRIPPGPLPRI